MLAPKFAVVGEEIAQGFGNGGGIGGEGADLVALEEFDVSFLLSGDDMVDEHGALGGDGFVHCGSSGFANDKVVGGEKLGNLAGPALEMDATGEFSLEFTGLLVKAAKVASQDNGDLSVVGEDGPDDVIDMGRAGSGKEEDPKRVDGSGGGNFGELFEAGADGKSGDGGFFFRDLLADEGFQGVGVGNEEVVARGAGPRGIDFDGIGNDGDNGDAGVVAEEPVDHVRVKRVGVDDEVGLEFLKEGGDRALGFRDEREGLGEILPVGGAVDPGPESGSVGGDLAIGSAEESVDHRVAQVTGVGDFDDGLIRQGLFEVSGGTIVTISEAGGENQDLGLHVELRCQKM